MNDKIKKAFHLLKEGNARFSENRLQNPRWDPQTREKLTAGQNPIAALLTCSDSRVSPDLVFDKGLGDLFVMRNAGNVAGPSVIASIEYAVAELDVGLVVVMGHENCGAVQAAIDGVDIGHIGAVTERIKPAVKEAKSMPGELLDNAIRLHTQLMVEELRQTGPIIKPACDEGVLEIIPAFYSLQTGKVTYLENR